MSNPKAETFKSEGNNFFKNGQYKEAIEKYEQASQIDPTVPAYFSNAAACWEKLGNYEKMAEAGRNSIKADRRFVKGYFRLATAQKNLNQLGECIKTLENGLGVDPSNVDLKQMKKEITELQRGGATGQIPQAEAFKSEGNNFFKNRQYKEAIEKYEQASQIDPTVPAYFSNAAACWEKLGNYEKMAEAGKNSIKADRNFAKGYFRLATAQKNLNQLGECIKTLENGLGVDPSNIDLKQMKKEITELQRGEQVSVHIAKAEEQLQNGEIAAAMKTLELASRLDAGNADIERMLAKVKPKYDELEAKRKASLSSTEIHKERGDEAYKNANFELAVEHYTKCIDALKHEGKGESELALKAYSNRAACYKQISNFDGTIADCTAVLEIDHENVKALVRRAQAFEGVERYRFALQDVKTVLSMPPGQVGKANLDMCNMMQHRLNRTVAALKKMG